MISRELVGSGSIGIVKKSSQKDIMGFEEIDQNYLFHYQCFMAKAVSGICREDVRNYGDSCVYSDVIGNP